MLEIITKKCSNCKETKNINFFSKQGSTKDGYQYWCKECNKAHKNNNKEKYLENSKSYAKIYRLNHPEVLKERRAKYSKENKDKIAAKDKRYGEKNSVAIALKKRAYYLVRKALGKDRAYYLLRKENNKEMLLSHQVKKYGITSSDYLEMFEKQSGECAICHCKQNGRRLAVDHDHSTGKVRGLLCVSCNSGLGYAKDDLKILANMMEYLQK